MDVSGSVVLPSGFSGQCLDAYMPGTGFGGIWQPKTGAFGAFVNLPSTID